MNGQNHDGGLYQSSWLTSIAHAGADSLELRPVFVTLGDACSRNSEYGGRNALQGHTNVLEMGPASGGGGTDLGS